MILFLLLACADSADGEDSGDERSCDVWCVLYQECEAIIPGNTWYACESQCDVPRSSDEFTACMADAYASSGVEEYGPDYEGCTDLYNTCSSGALAQSGG